MDLTAAAIRKSSVMGKPNALSAREVCQILREVVFGRSCMTKAPGEPQEVLEAGRIVVDAGGWRLMIYSNCGELEYCQACVAPDGREWSFDSGDRSGTDPVALLSTWEHSTLERLLHSLDEMPADNLEATDTNRTG